MLPDILGYRLDKGIQLLKEQGVDTHYVLIDEYNSPKNVIMGTDKRIIRADEKDGKVILIVGSF